MIRFWLVRPLWRILDSKYHPSDALLFLFKLIYSTLSNFKIHLKIETSLWWDGLGLEDTTSSVQPPLGWCLGSQPLASHTLEAESWAFGRENSLGNQEIGHKEADKNFKTQQC